MLGTLTLTDSVGDGKVTGGNNTGHGGGVYVAAGGSLTLGNADSKDFTITGNVSALDGGGVYAGGDLTVSGGAGVFGNYAGGAGSNIHLPAGQTITVAPDTVFRTDGDVGCLYVTMADPGVFTAGADLADAAAARRAFQSDDGDFVVVAYGGQAALSPAEGFQVTLSSGVGGSLSAKADGTVVTAAGQFPYGTALTLTAAAAEGYHLDKLTVTPAGGEAIALSGSTYTVTGDVAFAAAWTLNRYSVTFESAGGSAVAGQTVDHGGTVTRPADPTQAGYTFKAWTLNGAAYDFAAPVTSDLTLKAAWTANEPEPEPEPQPEPEPEPEAAPVLRVGEPFSQTFRSPLTFDGGKIVVSPKTAYRDDEVTLTVVPDPGMELKSLSVKQSGTYYSTTVQSVKLDSDSNGVYTFKMPDGKVEIEATFVRALVQTAIRRHLEVAARHRTVPAGYQVMPSRQTILFNGREMDLKAYNINGSNYVMLRDLAVMLSGTSAQFGLRYDGEDNRVILEKGASYHGTLSDDPRDLSDTACKSAQKVFCDGNVLEGLTVFNIGGSNYFSLRELAPFLGYCITYDDMSDTAIISA